jgi:hypothetical protein
VRGASSSPSRLMFQLTNSRPFQRPSLSRAGDWI